MRDCKHGQLARVCNICEMDQEIERLRAEFIAEHKRQSAMRTLIAAQEGALSHYRSKQAEADEAVRTLDSERAANAALTAELAACRALLMNIGQAAHGADENGDPVATLKAIYDAARKGEGE